MICILFINIDSKDTQQQSLLRLNNYERTFLLRTFINIKDILHLMSFIFPLRVFSNLQYMK